MVDILGSSLLKEMREEDPRRWLVWVLGALIERLANEKVHPRGAELRAECVRLRDVVTGWPEELYSPNEAVRLIKSVDAIASALGVTGTKDIRGISQISDIRQIAADDVSATTYSLTKSEPPKRKRKRKRRRGRKRRSEPPSTPAPPPGSKPPPLPSDEAPEVKISHESLPPELDLIITDGPIPRHTPPKPTPRYTPPRATKLTTALVRRPPAVPEIVSPRPADVIDRRSVPPSQAPPSVGEISIELIEIDPETCNPNLTVIADPRAAVAEAYRSLFFRLGATSDARVVMVTCTSEEENSAACAANLALAIGEASDEPALLIEARFSKPRLAALFGYHPSECFGRRLGRHRREPDAAWRVAQLRDRNLSVLAVDPDRSTAPALDAQALADVVQWFRSQGFGHIIVDGPPSTGTSDARYVARAIEGVVVAITAGVSRRSTIRRAVDVLGGAPVLGYVLLGQ